MPRPLHQTPSSHLPFVHSHPDPAELDDLSSEDSDEGATLAVTSRIFTECYILQKCKFQNFCGSVVDKCT